MKKYLSLLLVLAMLVPAILSMGIFEPVTSHAETPAQTVYVDDTGDDANAGTLDSPFKTLGVLSDSWYRRRCHSSQEHLYSKCSFYCTLTHG